MFVSAQNQTISKAARIAPFDLLPKVSETVTHFIKDQSDYSQASRRALALLFWFVNTKPLLNDEWYCLWKNPKAFQNHLVTAVNFKNRKDGNFTTNHGRVLLQTVIVYWCALSEEVAIKC